MHNDPAHRARGRIQVWLHLHFTQIARSCKKIRLKLGCRHHSYLLLATHQGKVFLSLVYASDSHLAGLCFGLNHVMRHVTLGSTIHSAQSRALNHVRVRQACLREKRKFSGISARCGNSAEASGEFAFCLQRVLLNSTSDLQLENTWSKNRCVCPLVKSLVKTLAFAHSHKKVYEMWNKTKLRGFSLTETSASKICLNRRDS